MSTLARVALASIAAVFVAALRRLRRGPLVPGWSWPLELAVALQRTALSRLARGDPSELRRLTSRGLLPFSPAVRRVRVESARAGDVRGHWIRPARAGEGASGRAILYLHGGGYVFGGIGSHRDLLARLALAAEARIFALDYRLAPEHPFPAAVEDALAAYRWLVPSQVDPARLVVAGDSAGGGLSLALLQELRSAGVPPPGGAVLLSPWVDLELRSESIDRNAATDTLSRDMLARWSELYRAGASARDPLVSPLHARLEGIPPLLVLTGGAEALLDEDLRLVEHAERAGVRVELRVADGMPHDWPLFGPLTPQAAESLEEMARFVRGLGSA